MANQHLIIILRWVQNGKLDFKFNIFENTLWIFNFEMFVSLQQNHNDTSTADFDSNYFHLNVLEIT